MSAAAPPAGGVLWDTMFASRLRPSRPEFLAAAIVHRGTAMEPLLSGPVVSEVVFGLRRQASMAREAAWWEREVVTGARRFRFVPTRAEAVILAARVRALQPTSPTRQTRTKSRRHAERRASWIRDIELAAIAATTGLPLATENLRDFTAIAAVIADVAPRLALDLRETVFA